MSFSLVGLRTRSPRLATFSSIKELNLAWYGCVWIWAYYHIWLPSSYAASGPDQPDYKLAQLIALFMIHHLKNKYLMYHLFGFPCSKTVGVQHLKSHRLGTQTQRGCISLANYKWWSLLSRLIICFFMLGNENDFLQILQSRIWLYFPTLTITSTTIIIPTITLTTPTQICCQLIG